MTLPQIEAEIARLSEAVATLRVEEDVRRDHWRRWTLLATICGLLQAAAGTGLLLIGLTSGTASVHMIAAYGLVFAAFPAVVLSNVLQTLTSGAVFSPEG